MPMLTVTVCAADAACGSAVSRRFDTNTLSSLRVALKFSDEEAAQRQTPRPRNVPTRGSAGYPVEHRYY
ncbi:hypothetical protein KCP73_00635 [Salmonella enterica subsp. enterica]|nr:hypothetical protein KCP73_00635 [Salmonella enterica subsp. enterica]